MKKKNMFYKISVSSSLLLIGLSLVTSTYAANNIKLNQRQNTVSTNPSLLKKLVQGGKAVITNSTIAAINGNSFTVTANDGKTYTVNSDAKTRFRRRFWGSSNTGEMQVGDNVNVIGKWTDDAHTIIGAIQVRDLSIMKRFGAFVGNVTGLTTSGWTLQTINRGVQTVSLNSTTKFVNRKNQTITQTDIVVGQRVRIKGLWDNKSNTITEVSSVKDYSLPLKSISPTPTIKPVK